MKIAAVSELKAKLARYLRLVKSGETVEVRERGVPIARLSAIRGDDAPVVSPPNRDPARISSIRFSVKLAPGSDVVEELLRDRKKR